MRKLGDGAKLAKHLTDAMNRECRGSQRELAALIGIAARTLRRLMLEEDEGGDYVPTHDTLYRVWKYLSGLPEHSGLREEKVHAWAGVLPPPPTMEEIDREAAELFAQLNRRRQREAIEYMRMLGRLYGDT